MFISIISLSLENQYLTYILLSLIAITAIVLIYDDLKNPFIIFSPLKAKSSIEVGYFLFEKVDVTIYSNYHYLFNKCHDTLRRMKLWIIEVNEVVGTLEALQINILSFNAIRIKIQIDKFESKSDTFQIKLEFIKEINLLQRSKFTNRLINELISKPKSADQKAESKVDIPTDVGD